MMKSNDPAYERKNKGKRKNRINPKLYYQSSSELRYKRKQTKKRKLMKYTTCTGESMLTKNTMSDL